VSCSGGCVQRLRAVGDRRMREQGNTFRNDVQESCKKSPLRRRRVRSTKMHYSSREASGYSHCY